MYPQLPYKDYLKTPHWKKTKRALYNYRKGVCQDCGCFSYYENSFDGHHLTYKNLWHEDIKRDLALLCNERMNGCHYRRHRRKRLGSIRPSDILFWIGRIFVWMRENYTLSEKHYRRPLKYRN